MKRFIRLIAISVGVFLAVCFTVVIVWTLAVGYRFDRQSRRLVASISRKLAPVLASNPQLVWDTDLRPHGFPEDNFDSPYTAYSAPTTVAMSDSLAAVVFPKSHYVDKKLVKDGHLIMVSLANGSMVTTAQWLNLTGLGPSVHCCTRNMQFYGFEEGYFAVRNGENGEVVGQQRENPVGPSTQKVNVSLGTNGRPSSIEIVHENKSKSTFQTDCGNVGDSFLAKDAFVIIGCSKLTVIGTDRHIFFSDAFTGADSDVFTGADLKFGGASKNGKRFIISVTAWHPGDPPYLTDEWLVVYDFDHRAPVFAVKSDPLPYQQSQSALSAEGNKLLIGSGGHLKLINVLN